MPGWGWFLIGTLSAGVVVLVIILLVSKKGKVGLTEEEKKKLIESEVGALKAELEIEKEKIDKLKKIAEDKEARLAELRKLFEEDRKKIDAKKHENYKKYLGDPDVAGAEFDRIFGEGTDTDPGAKPSTSEEG